MESGRQVREPRSRRPPERFLHSDSIPAWASSPPDAAREWCAPSEQRGSAAADRRLLVEAVSGLRLGGDFMPGSARAPRAAEVESCGPSDHQLGAASDRRSGAAPDGRLGAASDCTSSPPLPPPPPRRSDIDCNVISYARFNEVKDALYEAIMEMEKTARALQKASEEHYFPDKEVVSWRVTHDACVLMQKLSISLDESATRSREVFDRQMSTPSDLSFPDDPLTMKSDYDTDWDLSENTEDYYDPRFDDPRWMDTDNEC